MLAPSLGWRNVPVAEIMARLTDRPVMVDNNVRAMALAESMFGAARDVNMLAFVYSRVGVGAGFVVGGQLYRGTQYGAGEIGHTTVIPVGGKPCRCGNTGCLETLVSEGEIVRQAGVLAEKSPASILATMLSVERSGGRGVRGGAGGRPRGAGPARRARVPPGHDPGKPRQPDQSRT